MPSATLRRAGIATLALGTVLGVAAPTYAAGLDEPPGLAAHRQATETPAPDGDADGPVFTQRSDGTAALADKLGQPDLTELRKAEVKDQARVTVLVATKTGDTHAVADAVDAVGGVVGRSEDKLGYVRATVAPDDVAELADRDDVLAIDLDRTFDVPDTSVSATPTGKAAVAAPGASTPADNPYLPVGETGATDFTAKHPTWDGRGVTVGILDTGVDLSQPALQRTTTGQPKIADWFTATDPVVDNDASWARVQNFVTGPTFTSGGITWTAPNGRYGLVILNEASFKGELGGDLNRDGDTTDRIGVLYDPETHDIRVDANLDFDFTDDPVMRPYDEGHQVGYLGTDDPATDVAERLPFTVDYREDVDLSPLGGVNVGKTADYVNLGVVSGAHGTHVAGIVAGNGVLGGSMRGAAPGAQIVSARACTFSGGCTTVALTEGMIDLVTEHHVDVVNLSVGGLTALNDGSDAIAQLYDRLIDQYGVQIVVSAGNDGAGVNTVSPPSTSASAISVAASVSKQTWRADYGADVKAAQGMFPFSARGPGEDGGGKPDLAAPGAAVSTVPSWMPGAGVAQTGYSLPAGYQLMNGTSMAAPEVTGDAALLLSAASADRTEVTARGLKTALTDGARPIHGVPTAAQGSGLADVTAAWKVLSKGVGTGTYDVAAPVCTSLSSLLTTPNTGTGVYNRCLPGEGGQQVGATKTYDVAVARTDGGATRRHKLSWVGNDGTFAAPKSVDIGTGKVEVPVTARPATAGLHSAILQVDDPSTHGTDLLIPVTIVVPRAAAAPTRTVVESGLVARSTSRSFFVSVPEGVANLQLNLSRFGRGDVRVIAFDPSGMPRNDTSASACFTVSDPGSCNPTDRAYLDPEPGVWEFQVEARRTSVSADNPFRASVALQGVAVGSATTTIDELAVHQSQGVDMTATNDWGTTDVHAEQGAVGRVRDQVGEVAEGATDEAGVYVPRDVTEVDMSFTPRDADADLEVYVFVGSTLLVKDLDPRPGEVSFRLLNPPPGTYHVVVSGTRVPSGSTAFDYHEAVFSDGIGTVTVDDRATHRLQSGDRLPVRATITPTAEPTNDLGLVASVPVANAQGVTIGHTEVGIGAVTTPQATVLSTFKPMVASDLNDAGLVVGDHQVAGYPVPTRWTQDGGFVDYDMGVGGKLGTVYDTNEDGTAVGEIQTVSDGTQVGLWRPDGTRVQVGRPDWRAYTAARAFGLNDKGVVVGDARASIKESDGLTHSYIEGWTWTEERGFTRLADLDGDPSATTPFAVDDDGYVVGVSLVAHAKHAVLWHPDGSAEDLGTLPGQQTSMATAISADGTVVGTSGDDAFVWTRAGGMKRLPDYGFNGTATKVTDDGWVLGSAELEPDVSVPVVWDPQGRIYDLSRMIDPATLSAVEPMGINNRHQVLVYGYVGSGSGMALVQLPG
ncbi:S8 family serine peptidase [Luteimicrobium sp. DT211]|uniref:S8 family serine peptidase n=1 Tax=Luteimicrobium sp. DT211 TaxID=3393412 RepID=UPI003CF6B180